MAGLMGLSPQEINAISGRRQAAEGQRMQQLRLLMGMLGSQKTAGLEREKLDLAKEKFAFEKDPPMVKMKIGEAVYDIPRGAQVEGAKAKAEVAERLRTGRISQAQHDAWMKPVVTSLPRGDGGWVEYEVPSGMLQEMAAGIKSLQDVRVSGVEAERKRQGIEALGETTIGGIGDVPLSTLAETMPSGVIPAMVAKPGTAVEGLKPEERRKLIVDHEVTATSMLEKGAETSDASISAYNDRSKTLNYPSMMFRYKEIKPWWPDVHEVVEIKLPVVAGEQITPTQVQEAATKRGVAVDKILETIHAGQLAIESTKR